VLHEDRCEIALDDAQVRGVSFKVRKGVQTVINGSPAVRS
jgi:hypothetical protein